MTRRTAAAELAARELSSPEPESVPAAASASTSKAAGAGSGYRLKFKDALLPKSGSSSASSSDALLRKLKALHEELSDADLNIDALDLSSFEQVKDDLVRREILFHKDPGVKAFAACCIADLLRFYAPDAPYSPAQVEDIFAFFLNLLAGALRPTRYFTQQPVVGAGPSAGRQAAETRSSAPTLPPTKNEFYSQYFYLVESVATCKSIILCLDAEEQRLGQAGADESGAVRRCFEVFFDVVRYDLPRTLTDHMVDILATLIDECAALAPEIRNLLLRQFDTSKVDFNQRALDMAVSVCGFDYPMQKLERSFAQYFMEALLSPGGASSSGKAKNGSRSNTSKGKGKRKSAFTGDDDTSESEPDDEDEDEDKDEDEDGVRPAKRRAGANGGSSAGPTLEATHALLRSIITHAPLTLLTTIPVLETELENPLVPSRLAAVETLGAIWNVPRPLGAELVAKAGKSWAAWVRRGRDREWRVRKAWVEKLGGLLRVAGGPGTSGGVDTKGIVEPHLRLKIKDPDDRVREATCRLFGRLDYETARHHVARETLLALADRLQDKKIGVRAAAVYSMARLYSLASSEIDDNETNATRLFGWMPDKLLHAARFASPSVREIIEHALYEHIVPLPPKGDDATLWTDKLLLVLRSLADPQKRSLLALAGFSQARGNYALFVRACEEWNGGTVDENEDEIRRRKDGIFKGLSAQFPDPAKAKADMDEFADANENRLIKLLKGAMDPQTDLKTLVKINTEFARRCQPNLLATMSIVLRRGSFPCINRSSVPTLLKRLQRVAPATTLSGLPASAADSAVPVEVLDANAANARLVLETIAKTLPAMFKAHASELQRLVLGTAAADDDDAMDGGAETADKVDVAEIPLQALAHLARADASLQPSDRKLLERTMTYAVKGNARQAKFAARLLAYSTQADSLTVSLAKTLAARLDGATNAQLSSAMAALAELGRSAPDALEGQSQTVFAFILREFAKDDARLKGMTEDETDEVTRQWVEDDELTDRARAKLAALKLCVNRSLSHAQTDSAVEVVAPVLKMLLTILTKRGFFVDEADGVPLHARVRLQASRSLLKLARSANYSDLIKPNFLILAVQIQDPCFFVRQSFIRKLTEYLRMHRLHYDFTVMLYLAAHDEDEITALVRAQVKQLVDASARTSDGRQRQLLVYGFVRLIHLLAHHPDYSKQPEDLLLIVKYLDFFLDIIATKDNVSLLYALASKVKTVRDRDADYDENIYVVGELALHTIQRRTKTHHWTLDTYPGHIKMPGDLFRPMADKDDVQKNRIRVYLPDETLKTLRETKAPAPPKKEKEEKPAGTKRKRATTKRAKKKGGASEDEDEESDLSEPPTEDEEAASEPELAKKARPKPKARTTKGKALASDDDNDDNNDDEAPDSDVLMMGEDDEDDEPAAEEEEVLGRGGRRRQAAKGSKPAKSRGRA